jgi:molybdate transport system permease protein
LSGHLSLAANALGIALLLLPVGIPIARLLSRGGPAIAPLWAAVLLPLLVPPAILAPAFGPLREAGGLVAPWFPWLSPAAPMALLLSLPFAVIPLYRGFRAVDPRLLEAAELLGANAAGRFRAIVLPLSRPALLTAGLLSAMHAGWLLLLFSGESIPGGTLTGLLAATYGVLLLAAWPGARRP